MSTSKTAGASCPTCTASAEEFDMAGKRFWSCPQGHGGRVVAAAAEKAPPAPKPHWSQKRAA